MTNEKKQAKQEREYIDEAHAKYLSDVARYKIAEQNNNDKYLEYIKEKINRNVEECEKKLPKSLFDKLEMKKIE
jgi:hypothetical protein